MTYENRKTGKLYEVTVTRKGRVYLKGSNGESRSVPEGSLSKSYKKVQEPERKPLSPVVENYVRTSQPGPPPKPVGVLHEPPEDTDRFTYIALGLGALVILAMVVWFFIR